MVKRGVALDQGSLDLTEDDPDRQIISYSELSTFRQCPLKHHLSYQRRWTKPPAASGALAKGSLWHLVLEEHYRTIAASAYNGKPRTQAQDDRILAKAWGRIAPLLYDDNGKQTEIQELIEWMYEGHVRKWGTDPTWKILAVEHQIRTPLPKPDGSPSRFILKAKLDLIVLDLELGTRWVVDHKSGGDLPSQQDLEMDDQFGLYSWAMNQVKQPVQGSLHNAARTTRNKGDYPGGQHGNAKAQTLEQRMKRSLIARGKTELENIAFDAFNAAQAAYPEENQVRSLYSSPNPRQCGWMCDMRTEHLMMRQGRNPDDVMREMGWRVDFTRH